jgi:argininosuccinate lyase
MKMWSGRFSGGLDPEFESWQRSFPFDQRLLPQEIAASKAHARALKNAGVLTDAELKAVLEGLERILAEGIPAQDDPEVEDVHHFVEKRLIAAIGETGRKLHTGRSRNEQIATDLRLYIREAIEQKVQLLGRFIAALLEQAERAGAAAMPSYTHLQRAEPVLVAHWLLAYVEMSFRDIDRLTDCRARLNQCPLGSGAIAGTILPLDREAIAKELGFDGPTKNSLDATSDRDFCIEFVQAVSTMGMHLSRWAEELALFSTKEYGFVTLPEQYATGSSAMPQKKNPDSLELIRGKSAALIASATQLLITMKGLPLAYNKDMQETQQPVFAAAEQSAAMLKVAAGFMTTAQLNLERMQTAASTGFMNAMAAAGYLVRQGVPFRSAHEQIGSAVRLCVEKVCELQDLSASELQSCGIRADAGFYAALQLTAVLGCHDVPGGTAPEYVKQALAAAKERVATKLGAIHACA